MVTSASKSMEIKPPAAVAKNNNAKNEGQAEELWKAPTWTRPFLCYKKGFCPNQSGPSHRSELGQQRNEPLSTIDMDAISLDLILLKEERHNTLVW